MKIVTLCLLSLGAAVIPNSMGAQAPPSVNPIRVNSAGPAYTGSQARVWRADTGFSGGSVATSPGRAIGNTVDDTLYQSERYGAFNYTFTVPAGSYQVTLKFAETHFTSGAASGQRQFNVRMNGATVLTNFDIKSAAGGANIAVDRTFTVNAGAGSNNLQIQFIHLASQPDLPTVNAVEIVSAGVSVSGPAITTQPANRTVVAGQTATFSVGATGTAPLGYQWRKNGGSISGATSATYTTPAATTTDNGAQFTVVVSNSAGSITSNSAALTVSGATRLLSASPSSLSFGNVTVGSNRFLTATLTNTGNSNVTVSNVSISGAGLSAGGVSAGQILMPGQGAFLNMTFAPAVIGSLTGSVVVTSNASNSPATISLSGMAVPIVPRVATLSWNPSSSVVWGYNVYTSTVSGGPYTKLTPAPTLATSYSDASVRSGRTYYYVVTAVNSSSVESIHSNEASAVIP